MQGDASAEYSGEFASASPASTSSDSVLGTYSPSISTQGNARTEHGGNSADGSPAPTLDKVSLGSTLEDCDAYPKYQNSIKPKCEGATEEHRSKRARIEIVVEEHRAK
jgi:hypothetical protein